MSYNGNWKMNIMVDSGIMESDAEVEELMSYFLKELSVLNMEVQV